MTPEPIKVGIICVHPEKGWAATADIPALQELSEFKLTAVSHQDRKIAEAAAEKFGAEHVFTSADCLVDHDVDLVAVAVRVTQHMDLVSKAIEAGKAVFSEWLLAMTLGETFVLRDLAVQKGGVLVIGPQTRVSAPFAYQMKGAQRDEKLHELYVPASYGADRFADGPAQGVAIAYARLASDMRVGTTTCPTFEDAAELRRLIDVIERSATVGHVITLSAERAEKSDANGLASVK